MVELDDVAALEPDPSPGRLDQTQDAASGGRLSAARFTDQPESFASADLEADVIDRVHLIDGASEHAALHREVLH